MARSSPVAERREEEVAEKKQRSHELLALPGEKRRLLFHSFSYIKYAFFKD
jgi:hypothetical protein